MLDTRSIDVNDGLQEQVHLDNEIRNVLSESLENFLSERIYFEGTIDSSTFKYFGRRKLKNDCSCLLDTWQLSRPNDYRLALRRIREWTTYSMTEYRDQPDIVQFYEELGDLMDYRLSQYEKNQRKLFAKCHKQLERRKKLILQISRKKISLKVHDTDNVSNDSTSRRPLTPTTSRISKRSGKDSNENTNAKSKSRHRINFRKSNKIFAIEETDLSVIDDVEPSLFNDNSEQEIE
ncbi:hypothetical protein SNEBB_000872 [Seison nebaliae]|nr:hypothetical protein SNEBB_000872 [Seison nebaliae]